MKAPGRFSFLVAACLCFAFSGDGQAQGTDPAGGGHVFSRYPVRGEIIQGIVVGYTQGVGMVVQGDNEFRTIYGIGPLWYWQSQYLRRPAVGSPVMIDACVVVLPGGEKTIAVSVSTDTGTLELRDPHTGVPVWMTAEEQ